MRNAILAAIIAAFATGAVAGPPPKYLDVDVNFQQLQKLPTINAQQGASMLLVVRPKVAGGWLSLTNMTATWQARASMTSTNYYGSASTDTGGYTSNAVHQIAIPLDDGDTGDALTNWTYSVALVFGGDSYPIGTGVYNVARTTFQGGGTLLNDTNIWATKTWVLGQGYITTQGQGDIGSVAVSGGLLTGGGTNGAVTVGLTTQAVVKAVSDQGYVTGTVVRAEIDTLATVLARGSTSGGYRLNPSEFYFSPDLPGGNTAILIDTNGIALLSDKGIYLGEGLEIDGNLDMNGNTITNGNIEADINGVPAATVTAGAAAGATAVQPTDNLIVVTHRDGSITAYENPSANTDVARGSLLKSVVDGAAQYDHIKLAPAAFDLVTNGLICVQNTTLQGSGRFQTVIYSQRRFPAHQPNMVIVDTPSGFSLVGLQVNANYSGNTAGQDPYQFQFPVGAYVSGAMSLDNIKIMDCLLVGTTDALYYEGTSGSLDVRVYDTRMVSAWDCLFIKNVGGEAQIYNCDLASTKSITSPTLSQPRACSYFGTGTLSLYNTRFAAANGDMGSIGVYAESGTVNVMGGRITTTGSANVYDITEAGTATINVFAGASYDPAKISGTPNVGIAGNLTGTVDGTAAATIKAGAAAGATAQQPATTLSGYGITDAQPLNSVLTAWASTTAWADRCIAYSSAATENFAQFTPKTITLGTSTLDAGALSRSGNTITGFVNGGLYFYQLSTSWSSATAGDMFTIYIYADAGSISIGTNDGGTATTPAATGIGSVFVSGFFWATSANTTVGIKGVTTGAAGALDVGANATKITVVRVK